MSLCIFDASAVIVSLLEEPGADHVASLLTDPENISYISAVNMSEVFQKLIQHDCRSDMPGHRNSARRSGRYC